MTYTIFCIFDTEKDYPFEIEIDETMSIARLQRAIKAEEPKYAAVAPRKFELYAINAKGISEAKAKSQDLSKLKRFEAWETISDAFGSTPAKGLIHLLVKIAGITPIISVPTSTIQAGHSIRVPTGHSINMGPAALIRPAATSSTGPLARTKGYSKMAYFTVPNYSPLGLHSQFMSVAKSVRREIRSLPNITFSDPYMVISLPFPSPLWAPPERFTIKGGIVTTFQYMGRTIFRNILKEVEDTNFQVGRHGLFLYGPSGTGKSHILAALVCHLIKNGKKVMYIPDCVRLLEDHEAYIQQALLFAFYDDADAIKAIIRAQGMHDLLQFINQQPAFSLYIIVDQCNGLEIGALGVDMKATSKVVIWDSLHKLCRSQKYIFSASTNGNSVRFQDRKQSDIKIINMLCGLNEDETNAWFKHHALFLPEGTQENRRYIEDMTGRIPLLLRPLLGMKKFDKMEFVRCEELRQVMRDTTLFYDVLFGESSGSRRERLLRVAKGILLGQRINASNTDYDLRYFYFDDSMENGVGRATCGIAYRALLDIYRRFKGTMDDVNELYIEDRE